MTFPITMNKGNLQHEQRIFQTINQAIEEADSYIVIDMFLFNAFYDEKINFPKLTETLKDNLVEQKKKKPEASRLCSLLMK